MVVFVEATEISEQNWQCFDVELLINIKEQRPFTPGMKGAEVARTALIPRYVREDSEETQIDVSGRECWRLLGTVIHQDEFDKRFQLIGKCSPMRYCFSTIPGWL